MGSLPDSIGEHIMMIDPPEWRRRGPLEHGMIAGARGIQPIGRPAPGECVRGSG